METKNEKIEWLNAVEAAMYLKMALNTLYNKTHRKIIPFHKNGKGLIFKKSSLDQWLMDKQVLPTEPAPKTNPTIDHVIDHVADFFEESNYRITEFLSEETKIIFLRIYGEYEAYCKKNIINPLHKSMFFSRCKSLGFKTTNSYTYSNLFFINVATKTKPKQEAPELPTIFIDNKKMVDALIKIKKQRQVIKDAEACIQKENEIIQAEITKLNNSVTNLQKELDAFNK
jgi:excisionase family DNA binding protein